MMNQVEKLISELCPDGIEYRNLGDVCSFKRGTMITRQNARNGNVPVVSGGQKPSYYHDTSNRNGETISVSGSGAYAGFVKYWDIPVFLSDSFSVDANDKILNTKYLYYFLKSKQKEIHNKKKGSGVPHVYGKDLNNLQIPTPPP